MRKSVFDKNVLPIKIIFLFSIQDLNVLRDVVEPYITAIAAAEDTVQFENWDKTPTFRGKTPEGNKQSKQKPYSGASWENKGEDGIRRISSLTFPTDAEPFRRYKLWLAKEGIKELPTLILDRKTSGYTFGMLEWTEETAPMLKELFAGQEDILDLMSIADNHGEDLAKSYEIYFDFNDERANFKEARIMIERRLIEKPEDTTDVETIEYFEFPGKDAKTATSKEGVPAAIEAQKIAGAIGGMLSLIPTYSEPIHGRPPLQVMLNPGDPIAA